MWWWFAPRMVYRCWISFHFRSNKETNISLPAEVFHVFRLLTSYFIIQFFISPWLQFPDKVLKLLNQYHHCMPVLINHPSSIHLLDWLMYLNLIDRLFHKWNSLFFPSLIVLFQSQSAVEVFNLKWGVLQSVSSPVPHPVDFPAQRAPLSSWAGSVWLLKPIPCRSIKKPVWNEQFLLLSEGTSFFGLLYWASAWRVAVEAQSNLLNFKESLFTEQPSSTNTMRQRQRRLGCLTVGGRWSV